MQIAEPKARHPAAAVEPKLWSIQALRAIAALGVLLFHALEALFHNAGYPRRDFSNAGAAGVDLFFVVSGFVMVHAHDDWFGSTTLAKEFLARRLIRVVPLYWLVTGVLAMLLLAVPPLFNSRVFDTGHVVLSLLFIQSRAGSDFGVLHGAGWSLCFEMYFYLLLFALMPVGRRAAVIGIGAIFAVSIALGGVLGAGGTGLETFTHPMLLEFLAGMVLALAARRRVLVPGGFGWPLLLAGFAAIVLAGELALVPDRSHALRVIYWGLPAAAIVWAAVSLEAQGWVGTPRWLSAIGDASYSLYLFHLLTLPALAKAWRALGLQALPEAVFLALAMAVSIGFALLAYRYLERPMTRGLRRLWQASGDGQATTVEFR